MKPKARLKITLKCTRSCPYCINGCGEYRARWKKVGDIMEVEWVDYRSIVISGGEPTMDIRLRDIARGLRIFTDGCVPIYLQTNGARLFKNLVKDMDGDIDGIGLSVHDWGEFDRMLTRWRDILRVKPVRLYVEGGMYDRHQLELDELEKGGFGLRVWRDGESDPDEHIFLLGDTP